MRIARIITRLNIGGPAIHTILLTEGLNDKAFESYIVIGTPSHSEGDMSGLAESRKLNIYRIPELQREIGPRDIIAFWKLFTIFKKTRPDIVHTHTAKAGALGRIAAFLAGVPIKIHTFHGHIFDGYFNPRKARTFLRIERFLGRLTDKVIVVSENVKDEIVDKLHVVRREKCEVIPLGLELDKFMNVENLKGGFRRDLKLDNATLLVGIVGRLVPIKNHRMFLDVASRIKAMRLPEKVKFVIVGDGELKEDLERETRLAGLSEEVIFTGWAKDLGAVYADLDIVVLTSLNEGTPVSLIEAMASARPVVSTDVGGVSDIIVDRVNGLLVKNNDPVDFTVKLLELLKDSNKRSEFGNRAREHVLSRYSKDRLISDIKRVYEECLADKR